MTQVLLTEAVDQAIADVKIAVEDKDCLMDEDRQRILDAVDHVVKNVQSSFEADAVSRAIRLYTESHHRVMMEKLGDPAKQGEYLDKLKEVVRQANAE